MTGDQILSSFPRGGNPKGVKLEIANYPGRRSCKSELAHTAMPVHEPQNGHEVHIFTRMGGGGSPAPQSFRVASLTVTITMPWPGRSLYEKGMGI